LTDAVSESVLWSDRFSFEVEDLFDLQDEIAGAIAARLRSKSTLQNAVRKRLIRVICAPMASSSAGNI
jgi:hypothetical protein